MGYTKAYFSSLMSGLGCLGAGCLIGGFFRGEQPESFLLIFAVILAVRGPALKYIVDRNNE